MSVANVWPSIAESTRTVNWRGHSGRHYLLRRDCLDTFHLHGKSLFILGSGSMALWVGTADEVIASSERRTAFKAALKICSTVFRYDEPVEDLDRLAIAWDVENGQTAGQLRLIVSD